MIPATDEGLSNTDLLAIATEEMQSYVMSLLLSVREEYRVADYDLTVVAGTSTYRMPERAAGDKARDVLLLVGSDYVPLTRIEPERRAMSSATGSVEGFMFQDTDLVLVPTPAQSGTVRIKYFRRPSKLVATSAVATIATIASDRLSVTTSSTIPSTFTTSAALDFVDNNPGFRLHQMDLTPTVASGTGLTFATALPSSISAGDYVCLAGESPVPMCPVEVHPLLCQRTAQVAMEALSDPRAGAAEAKCDRMKKDALALLTPRSEGSARYLINFNGPGWQRRRGR